jgi:FkbM family methyltransferase
VRHLPRLIRHRWARRRFRRRQAGNRLLRALARRRRDAFFVEVGANDGSQMDHLEPFVRARGWRGIMVEPVPWVFERLRANYGDLPGVTLENVAIADRDGTLPFHHLAEAHGEDLDRLPGWYQAIGSFSLESVLEHRREIPDIDRRVVTIDVPCMTFETLCRNHGVGRIDVLVIDTEGYDWEVLRQVDLVERRPTVLVYEHLHLPAAVRERAHTLLREAGYLTMEEHFDTFCLDAGADRRLVRLFERLTPWLPPQYAESAS